MADALLAPVAAGAPLVHCLMNPLALDLTANLLLAAGAAPIMAPSEEELADILAGAGALVANMGMPDEGRLSALGLGAAAANRMETPWVLDPVGVGASPYRRQAVEGLIALRPTVIRGNAAEIAALADAGTSPVPGRGVDSTAETDGVAEAAMALARRSGAVVLVTGRIDLVTDGERADSVAGGHAWMARVSGLGCAMGGLVAACLATGEPARDAALRASRAMALAGDAAARQTRGPGGFRAAFVDWIHAQTGTGGPA